MLKYELIDLIELIRCNDDKELMVAFIDEFHQKILNICKGYENEYLETDLIISIINLVYNLNLDKFRCKSNNDLLKYINRSLENRAIDSYRKFKGVREKIQIYSLESLDYLISYYDDIDAIYFAKNIGKSPIAELLVNYYTNLVAMRQKLITNSIKKADKTLAESVYDMFTGANGLGMDFRGVGLFGFIYSKAGTELFESTFSKYPLFVQDVYKVCSYVFAAKIESLQNGYLKWKKL